MDSRLASLVIACALACTALGSSSPAQAERNTLGPHFGVNFDIDDPFLGIEGRFDVADIDRAAIVQLNPSFSLYLDDGINLLNFSFNVPFEFVIAGSVVRPMAAPGLAVLHFSRGRGSNTELALNLIGGVLFALDAVEPFVQLRIAIGDGSMAELMGGVLFRL